MWYRDVPRGGAAHGAADVQLERIIQRDTPSFSDLGLYPGRQSCASWAISASEAISKHAASRGASVRPIDGSLVHATDAPPTVVLVFSWWKDDHPAVVDVVRGVMSSRLGARMLRVVPLAGEHALAIGRGGGMSTRPVESWPRNCRQPWAWIHETRT